MTPVCGEINKITKFAFEAATAAADGMSFTLPRITEEYVVVLVQNTGNDEKSITVKAPTSGSYAASSSDLTLALSAGQFAVFRFESARWANRDGSILLIPGDVAVKAAVLY